MKKFDDYARVDLRKREAAFGGSVLRPSGSIRFSPDRRLSQEVRNFYELCTKEKQKPGQFLWKGKQDTTGLNQLRQVCSLLEQINDFFNFGLRPIFLN